MYISELTIENFRIFGEGDDSLVLELRPGLNALVGENDSGKTAIIDALRLALGTADQEWFRLEDSDFHGDNGSAPILIACLFSGLTRADRRAFAEFLSYDPDGVGEPVFCLNVTVADTGRLRRGRPYRRIEFRSGLDGTGPIVPQEARDLLRATYLRPLRDAEQELTSGRGSRLSQVLFHSAQVRDAGEDYDPEVDTAPAALSVLGIGDYADSLLVSQTGVANAKHAIDEHLKSLALAGEPVTTDIGVGGSGASDEARLRRILEKLDLGLGGLGRRGLGSNNRLFIACELLLLTQEEEGSRLLLIEEPEAHLDAQRQLQLAKAIREQAEKEHLQVILTTHSPNLASAVELNSMTMIRGGKAFPLDEGQTQLESTDYRFLQRFLDATKANLFFARGVLIVEGDAENVLLPTIAELAGMDLSKYGVSIVNVGGIGLRRYARIFQRAEPSEEGKAVQEVTIPVACITDLDVLPECAPSIIGREKAKTPTMLGEEKLRSRREALEAKASGQCVRTFVSDHWTLEYDLAVCGFAEDVYAAARLAKREASLTEENLATVIAEAKVEFEKLRETATQAVDAGDAQGCSVDQLVATYVYKLFALDSVSKPATAQYLADILRRRMDEGSLTQERFLELAPRYLLDAVEYVTLGQEPVEASTEPIVGVPAEAVAEAAEKSVEHE